MAKEKDAAPKFVVPMVVEKECKSCVRFKAANPEAAKLLATIYVPNTVMESLGNPDKIDITVTAGA